MMNEQLDDMYRDIILDHYRAPRGKKAISKCDISSEGHNPSCGDEVELQVEMEDGTIKDVHVDCRGCAISVASGSMLAEMCRGKSLEDVKQLSGVVKTLLKEGTLPDDQDLGDLDALQGVKKFPVRVKCALLAWATLMEGIKSFEGNGKDESKTSTEED